MSVRQRTGLLVLGRAPAHGVAACRRRALLRCKRRCCTTATAAAQQAWAGSETVSHLRHPHRESEVWLVGTSHVSQESVDEVASLIETLRPSQVMVELCPGRARQLLASHGQTEGAAPPPPGLLDLAAGGFSAAGAGGAAGAGLGAYGAVLRGLGMDPGQELRTAMLSAAALEIPVLYGDRPVEQTLARRMRAGRKAGKLSPMHCFFLTKYTIPSRLTYLSRAVKRDIILEQAQRADTLVVNLIQELSMRSDTRMGDDSPDMVTVSVTRMSAFLAALTMFE